MKLKHIIIGLVSMLGIGAAVGVANINGNNGQVKEAKADIGSVSLAGSFNGWKADVNPLTLSGDNYVITINFAIWDEFKIVLGGSDWIGYNADAAAQGKYSTNCVAPTDGYGSNFMVKEPGNYTISVPKNVDTYDDKTYGIYITKNYDQRYLVGNWEDESEQTWSEDGLIPIQRISDTHYELLNVSFEANTLFKMVYYSNGVLQWTNVNNAWSMDNTPYPASKSEDNVSVTNACIYNVDMTLESGQSWNYSLTPVVNTVADGGYLRGDWTNGWSITGQKTATVVTANTKYKIEGVDLSAEGKVKFVTYASGIISWCQFNSVSSTDPTNYPVQVIGGDAAVTNSGTYTITVTYNAGADAWDYEFEGTSNPALEAAVAFATAFNTAIGNVCNAGGATDTGDLATAWGNQATAFAAISIEAAKTMLGGDLSGSTVAALTNFAAKYDYVYHKYGKTLSLSNFASRSVTAQSRIVIAVNPLNSNAAPIIVAVIAVISLTAIGGYYFLSKNKKKENQ